MVKLIIDYYSLSPFVTFMSSISMSADREWMTGTSTAQKQLVKNKYSVQHNTRALTTSLVPRPFPLPVFDRILYAKTEGEGLGERVTCDVRVDTRGAVPDDES